MKNLNVKTNDQLLMITYTWSDNRPPRAFMEIEDIQNNISLTGAVFDKFRVVDVVSEIDHDQHLKHKITINNEVYGTYEGTIYDTPQKVGNFVQMSGMFMSTSEHQEVKSFMICEQVLKEIHARYKEDSTNDSASKMYNSITFQLAMYCDILCGKIDTDELVMIVRPESKYSDITIYS